MSSDLTNCIRIAAVIACLVSLMSFTDSYSHNVICIRVMYCHVMCIKGATWPVELRVLKQS